MTDINIVCTHFYPDTSSAASRLRSIVQALSQRFTINVIYLTTKKNRKIESSLKNLFEFQKNISFFPVHQKKYDSSNLFLRFLYEIFYTIKLNIFDSRKKAKISIISIPFLFLLPVAGFFRIPMRRYSILDIRDLTWLCLDVKDNRFLLILKNLIEKICLFACRRFNHITTTNQAQMEYLKKSKVKIPIRIVENGIESHQFKKLKSLKKKKVRFKNRYVILYAGRVGFPQNLTVMVKTAELLTNYDELLFVIVGTGNELMDIKKYISLKKLKNVLLTGEMEWEKVLEFYQEADILYAQLKDTEGLRTAQPAKIFEYAATGLPIIYGGKGEAVRESLKINDIYLINPDDPYKLKEEILKIYHKKDLLIPNKKMQDYIEIHCIREKILEKYILIIEEAL